MELILTDRQKDVVRAIRELSAEHRRNPSLEELGERVGLRSTHSVRRHLTNLQAKGITKPRRKSKKWQIALAEPLKIAV